MRLAYFDDRANWGKQVADAAIARGHAIDQDQPDVAFVRLLTFEPERTRGFDALAKYQIRGIPTMPGADAAWYDDKLAQVSILKPWLPQTFIRMVQPSFEWISRLEFPLVSKAHTGAQSRNVRLLNSPQEAWLEALLAFGSGIPLQPSGFQRGYILWQKFIPGNSGDIRVCVTGDYMFGLRRGNRDDVPFASGSGRLSIIEDLGDERTRRAFVLADEITEKLGIRWQAYDFVFDADGRAYCLEASSAWTEKAYNDCPLFHRKDLSKTWLKGVSWASIMVDELERIVYQWI